MNVLVMGATEKADRYAYKAVSSLLAKGHKVFAIGSRPGNVLGVNIHTTPPDLKDIDTVTLYLNATNQQPYYDYFLKLKPKRVIFNPGTENIELETMLEANGIETLVACTLVMLGTGQF